MNHPISFEYQEKRYQGELQPVAGSGGNVYHLMIDKFYYGRLRQANGSWVLDTNKKSAGMEYLASELGGALE